MRRRTRCSHIQASFDCSRTAWNLIRLSIVCSCADSSITCGGGEGQ